MSRLRAAWTWVASRPGGAAIVCLGICWGITMHSMGWAQLAHFGQVRAFAEGQAEIDQWHWETKDKAYVDGHFYSVKSPGVPAISLPVFLLIDTEPGRDLNQAAVENAREPKYPRWQPQGEVPIENFGYDPARAAVFEDQIERNAPMIWFLGLIIAVIPAVLLLFGVRWAGDRIEPGYGTAAAITLGLATIVATFAAEYFSHVIAAALGFGAFLALMREREGPPSTKLVALAGLAAGLSVTFEYQVGLVGVVLFFYALVREAPRLPRAAAYAAAAFAGAIPALAFNVWAFGSPFEFAYGSAVAVSGVTGHDSLGLNDDGLFGITVPKAQSAIDLLLGSRGLLALTPVAAAAIAGIVLMWRDGRLKAEAVVIAATCALYFVYNAGYWLPYGGGTPGPRFLIPALPFLALGLATAYRRLPAITLAPRDPLVRLHGRRGDQLPADRRPGPGRVGRLHRGRPSRAHAPDRLRRQQLLARDRARRRGGIRRDRFRREGDAADRARRPAPGDRSAGGLGLPLGRRPPAHREPESPAGRRSQRAGADRPGRRSVPADARRPVAARAWAPPDTGRAGGSLSLPARGRRAAARPRGSCGCPAA